MKYFKLFENEQDKRFIDAVTFNNIDLVKTLLKDGHVDPSTKNNKAIRFAARRGHTRVIELLLADSRVDPLVNGNDAIRGAARRGHVGVVKLLLADSRVNIIDVIKDFNKHSLDTKVLADIDPKYKRIIDLNKRFSIL